MAMLCCVSRKAAAGSDDVVGGARSRASVELSRFVEACKDLSKAQAINRQEDDNEVFKRLDEAVLDVAAVASSFSTFRKLETLPEEAFDCYNDAQPEVLHPCAVCGRKFNSRSLEKHVKICERTATKKRKPFDSAKQRIQGTELAEFLPKQSSTHQSQSHHTTSESRRPSGSHNNSGSGAGGGHGAESRRPSNQWKQTRDEFLRAIRAARGDTQPTRSSHHSSSHAQSHSSQVSSCSSNNSPATAQRPSTLSLVTASGAPTRSNEKGQCPTCQRQFGLKSYDRHVVFCRERATRLPASPQTRDNVAKERLEARMKYRAPALRNRKPTNREKYSPGAHKVTQSPLLTRSPMKDSNLSLNSTTTTNTNTTPANAKNNETASPKLPVLNKRSNQTTKESPAAASGPLKSRPMDRSNSLLRRSFERLPRCDWNSYVRRHPDFSMILRGRIGATKDYDPFLLAEQQLNDLFSDTSDQSSTDGSSICPSQKPNSSPNFPLSHGSAFVKYPNTSPKPQSSPQTPSQPQPDRQPQQRRLSVIAPPSGFDDLTSSDLSSDCTETNSLSRELFTSSATSTPLQNTRYHSNNSDQRELGRRLIIDPNQALGGGEFAPASDPTNQSKQQNGSRTTRPAVPARSNSLRSAAPKVPERKISSSSSSGSSDFTRAATAKSCANGKPSSSYKQNTSNQQRTTNGCKTLANGSSLSLSSIISDAEMKRSNSLFDELLSSFEDDAVDSSSTLPSLMSLMRNDTSLSLLSSSTTQQSPQPPLQQQQQQPNGTTVNGHHSRVAGNGRINCSDDDAELSSPESVKRQECGKLSADSAYSSLNRKYSTHGRSTNDVSCKYKLSKFCHECGFKFPDSAKFCCECGVKRLTL